MSSVKIATRCPYIVMGIQHAITFILVHVYYGCGVDHPPSSSAEVKETVELRIYFPPPPPWAFVAFSKVNFITCEHTKCSIDKIEVGKVSVYFFLDAEKKAFIQRTFPNVRDLS